jgi:hypothetical protein
VGDIAFVWSVLMWALNMREGYSVVIERRDVGSEQGGGI